MSEKSAGSVRSAQRVIEALTAQGMRYIFGVPGAKVDEVYDVLDDLGPRSVTSATRPQCCAPNASGCRRMRLGPEQAADIRRRQAGSLPRPTRRARVLSPGGETRVWSYAS